MQVMFHVRPGEPIGGQGRLDSKTALVNPQPANLGFQVEGEIPSLAAAPFGPETRPQA
jgi:hypothetical protein